MNSVEFLSAESQRLLAVWNALAPPIRPSSEEIESYARCWTGGEGLRVLVQGVTPELVDLALRQRASRVIAMDWQSAKFPAMRCLGREDWSHVENHVCDWRTFVPQLEGALDLVLGDGSLTMVNFPEDWERILRILHRYLVPGGRAVLRLAFQLEEPFDFDSYLGKTLVHFDAECAEAAPGQRARLLRGLIAEIRLAIGLGSAGTTGAVDLECRADLTRLSRAELTSRYTQWPEWQTIQVALPFEGNVRKGINTGKGVPPWETAVRLMEACRLSVRLVESTGTRPAPGAMRLLAAERV